MKIAIAAVVAAVGLTGAVTAATWTQAEATLPGPRMPVLAELFTSEGCSSCPPADDLLRWLIDEQPIPGVEVIALGEHVDYWNRLGWTDPFSSPEFSRRQEDYAKAFRTDRIYTPQLVVDGRLEVVGSNRTAVRAALAEAATLPHATVVLSSEAGADGRASARVSVTGVPASTARSTLSVTLAVVEDGLLTEVLRGENARRQLRHSAVVRRLDTIGTLDRGAASGDFTHTLTIDDGWRRDGLRLVAFLYDAKTRAVVGAATAPIR